MSKLYLNGVPLEFEFSHLNTFKWDDNRIITHAKCDGCERYRPLKQFLNIKNLPNKGKCEFCRNQEELKKIQKTKDEKFIEKFSENTYDILKKCTKYYSNKQYSRLIDFYLESQSQLLCDWTLPHFISKLEKSIYYNKTDLTKILKARPELASKKSLTKFLQINFKPNKIIRIENIDLSKKLKSVINRRDIDSALILIKSNKLRSIDIHDLLIKVKQDDIKAFAHILIYNEFDYRKSPDLPVFIILTKAIKTLVNSDNYKTQLQTLATNMKYQVEINSGEIPKRKRTNVYKHIIKIKNDSEKLSDYISKHSELLNQYKNELSEEIKNVLDSFYKND